MSNQSMNAFRTGGLAVRGVVGGLISGIIFAMAEMFLNVFIGKPFLGPLRLISTNVLGKQAAGPDYSLGTSLIVGLVTHMMMPIIFGLVFVHLLAAATALDYAHAQGIVHRDIKPANVMLLGETGRPDAEHPLPQQLRVVLADFSVARLAEATDRQDLIVGAPAYMSPEQASGQAVDGRADIYSLGVVVFQMLSGKVPVRSLDGERSSVQASTDRSLLPAIPNTSSAIQLVVLRALAIQPEDRYQRAGEFAAALHQASHYPSKSVQPSSVAFRPPG